MIQKNTRRRRRIRVKVFIEKPTKRNWRASTEYEAENNTASQLPAYSSSDSSEQKIVRIHCLVSIAYCVHCVYQRRMLLRMSTSFLGRGTVGQFIYTFHRTDTNTRRPFERVWRLALRSVGRFGWLVVVLCTSSLAIVVSRAHRAYRIHTHTHYTSKLDLHGDCTWNTKQFFIFYFEYILCTHTSSTMLVDCCNWINIIWTKIK